MQFESFHTSKLGKRKAALRVIQFACFFFQTMVEFNRVQCLRHPVSVAYLKQKW